MAAIYTNENVPLEIVHELRRLGHDALTSFEAGNANARVPDEDVLAFAERTHRVMITNNRRDFIQLHRRAAAHAGIVVFTFHLDSIGIASRIATALSDVRATGRFLARVDGQVVSFD